MSCSSSTGIGFTFSNTGAEEKGYEESGGKTSGTGWSQPGGFSQGRWRSLSDGAKTTGTDGTVHAATGNTLFDRTLLRALGQFRQSPGFRGFPRDGAKTNMLTCVAFRRLDRVLLNGRYVAPSLRPDDFAAIQRAILAALEIRT